MGVLVFGCCRLPWILGTCGGGSGVPGGECFCTSVGGRKERRCLGGNAGGPWERARVFTPKGGVPGMVVWKEEPLQAGCSRTESGPGDSIREDKKDGGHIPQVPAQYGPL